MYTDTDIVGLGEPVLEWRCNSIEAVIDEFKEYLIEKDPMQIEHHVQTLYTDVMDIGYNYAVLQEILHMLFIWLKMP